MTLLSSARTLSSSRFPIILTVLAAITITTGCGSSGEGVPKLSGNTSVTVLLSSTANDQLSKFAIGFTSISLTNQAGKTVSLLTQPQATQQWAEFIHVNGGAEPLVTVTVPQDIYTAATVGVADSYFTCVTLTPSGGLDTSTFAYGFTATNAPPTTVTVNLPTPITITGDSMGLALDMLVSQSATYSSCYDPNGMYTYSITPAFNLTPIAFSAHPTNPRNGKVTQINGEITALGITGNTFSLTLPEGARTLSIKADSNTEYEGIGNFATLTVGTFVDMDGAVQSDGSLLATRIAVEDTDIQNLSVLTGPVMQTNTAAPILFALGRAQQGYFSANHMAAVWMPYSDPSATFQISGQLGNLQSLPFVPSFNGTNVVDGQEVYVTTQVTSFSGGYPYIPATTVTLMPQTINGTVVASSTVGNFTDYRVSLSSYALFPALAVQQGQTTLLTNPGEVEVYVGSNTQMLNTMALAPGSTLRFYGLVFNDNGTLRMDCGQVNDGVTSSSQSSAANRLKAWDIQTVRGEGAGRMQPTITTVTRYR